MAEEIEYFKQIPNFFVVEIDGGSQKTRYGRFVKRDREDSKLINFDQFVQMENEQIKGNGGQELGRVLKLKDFKLDNTKTFSKLYKETDALLLKLEKKNSQKYKRPSWDEYYLRLIEVIGERGTCDRGRSGSVIVKDKRLVASGYVGSPMGMPHCDEVGHMFKKTVHEDGSTSLHCVRTIHAEQNAIVQAAKYGIPLDQSTLYCRMEPCAVCAKIIVNSGITRVVCLNQYHAAEETRQIFKECGVKLEVINKTNAKYAKQK